MHSASVECGAAYDQERKEPLQQPGPQNHAASRLRQSLSRGSLVAKGFGS
jgi:hypothetical protein